MPLVLEPTKDDDFFSFIHVMFDAVGEREPFVNAVYPRGFNADGSANLETRQDHAGAMIHLSHEDPTQHWFKVTDTDTGKIIGVAQYNVYSDMSNKPAEHVIDAPDGYWDSAEDKEWAQAVFAAQFQDRWKFIRATSRPLVCLNILTIAPEHQRRGAGRMLTKWGMDEADRLGGDMLLEAFGPGVPLYESLGFEARRSYACEVPAKFADRPKQYNTFMIRPAKGV